MELNVVQISLIIVAVIVILAALYLATADFVSSLRALITRFRAWRNRPRLPKAGERVVVVAHKRPDYDAWGSAVAIATQLRRLGCEVELVADKTSAYTVGVVNLLERAGVAVWTAADYGQDALARASRIFVVDCSGPERCAVQVPEELFGKVVWIDHHQPLPEIEELLMSPKTAEALLDTDAGSASSLVWEYLMAARKWSGLGEIDRVAAQAVLLGHLGDTLGLSKASACDLDVAADIEALLGKDLVAEVWSWYRGRTKTEARLRAMAYLKATDKAQDAAEIVAVGLDQTDFVEAGCDKSAMAGLAGELLDLEGVKAVVTATPDTLKGDFDVWRISVRTSPAFKVRAVDAARAFAGNGHPDAAGCVVAHADAATAQAAAAKVVSWIIQHNA